MLAKSRRLNLKKDFKWVASGSKIESQFLKLFFKPGDNVLPKIGIATSKSVFKKAHERNRARRLIAQAFQATYYLIPNTINIVALPKAGILEVKSSDVLADLEKALKNEKLIN